MHYLTAAEYAVRAGGRVPLVAATGATDTARIEAALDDASGEIRACLPRDLLDAAGAPVAPPPRLRDALPGITFALAQYALTDGATGAETAVSERYHAARKLLRELNSEPERPAVVAEIIEGAGAWIPGAAAADEAEAD